MDFKVRDLRLRMGWSQADLARHLECSLSEIEIIEDGADKISLETLNKLELIRHQADAMNEAVHLSPLIEDQVNKTNLEQTSLSEYK